MRFGVLESCDESPGALDAFLADCLKANLRSQPLPDWPGDWHDRVTQTIARIAVHGIGPLLSDGLRSSGPSAADWPADVIHAVRKEAVLAALWEDDHRRVIAALIDALEAADIPVRVTKGTALAYSVYRQPAMRRRGDTDILILSDARESARKVLKSCGFEQSSASRALQEDWRFRTSLGIHTVDVHWRLNGSAAVSTLLERGDCFSQRIALPAISDDAAGMGDIGNVILTCINRHSHGVVGYYVGHDKLFVSDRLIWAVDLYLLTRCFDEAAWERLASQALATGTGPIVLSGLAFAERTLGLEVPPSMTTTLALAPKDHDVAGYFATSSGAGRLRLDLAASPRLRDKARVALPALLPGEAFLRERFPGAQGWPLSALQLRRLVGGVMKLAKGKA